MVKLQYIIASLIILCGVSFGQVMPPQVFTTTNTLTATGGDTGFNIKASGINAVVLSWSLESGTNSGCAIQIEVSADNITFAQPTGGASQTCTSNGSTTLAILPANFIRVNLTSISGAGNTIRYKLAGYAGPSDPCSNSVLTQTPTSFAQAGSTQELSAAVTGIINHLCGGYISVSGPGATFASATFKAGTNGGTPCSSGQTTIGGAIGFGAAGGTSTPLGTGNATLLKSPVSQEICITGAGTTPSIAGVASLLTAPY